MSGSEGAQGSTTQAAAADRQSSRFSSTEGEIIVFRSADGTLFNIHRCNLRCTTDGPLAEDFPSTPTEVVSLTEDAKTLETLFAFVYPGAYPLLMNLPADEIMRVAEAAEKYHVAPAIGVCLVVIRLGALYKPKSIEVLDFAHKHGYSDLLELAAPHSLTTSIKEARKKLPISLFAAWAEYKETWENVAGNNCNEIRFNTTHSRLDPCPNWPRLASVIDERIADKLNLYTVPMATWWTEWCEVFRIPDFLPCCTLECDSGEETACEAQAKVWKRSMRDMAADIGPLSSFIAGE
ncbi:hypothetical protein K525DRAFT_270723 [Schizophyllum commune Loenen D]|nr:hypothetical protein K525DRAFT_270723 [Schizophyllum commune Loenen D]